MRKIRVLFEVYLLYHLPQFLPLYEVLRRDGRYELFFSEGGHADEERCGTVELLRGDVLDPNIEGSRVTPGDFVAVAIAEAYYGLFV